MIILTYILLISLSSCILLLQAKKNLLGSDHYYHIGIINGIRKNRHRFINKHPNLPYEKHFAYPQFFHWILSFIPHNLLNKYYYCVAYFLNIISLLLYFIFLKTVYFIIPLNIPFHQYLFFSGLVFVLTPFNFSAWNAKNVGISVRGFGLFLGQLFLYCITWYLIYQNIVFLFGLILIAFIILVSSQFTFQFVIFSSIFCSILYKNATFLLIPICAVIMFRVFSPKIFRIFIKGQLGHKTLYFKYLSHSFLFKKRYSIWRDFVWDFWVRLFRENGRPFAYIYRNPMVDTILGFPFLTALIIVSFLYGKTRELILFPDTYIHFVVPVIVCIMTFLSTSFRKTRFLGEPQRYIEFSVPYISIIAVLIISYKPTIFYSILIFSAILIAFQIFFLIKFKKNNIESRKAKYLAIDQIKLYINQNRIKNNTNSMFCNNVEFVKFFLGNDLYVLKPNLYGLYTGSFHYKEIFPKTYGVVHPKVFLPLLKEFKIQWFVLDKNSTYEDEILTSDDSIRLKKELEINIFILFRVCSKS